MISFWLLCVFFSPFSQGSDGPWLFGMLGWACAVFASVLTHELGHAFAMRKAYGLQPSIEMGIGTSRSGSFVFGGLTSLGAVSHSSYGKRAFTAAAGPGAEIGVALIFTFVLSILGVNFEVDRILGFIPAPTPDPQSLAFIPSAAILYFIYYLIYGYIYIGVLWGVFNLTPVYPFDGGQLLLALLSRSYGAAGIRMTLIASIVCSIFVAFIFFRTQNFLMALFFLFSAYQNYQLLTYQGYR